MRERTLDTIAAEVGGIASTLQIISAALDPNGEFNYAPESCSMSLFALVQHLERLQVELDEAHMQLEVKPKS